ncbi:MAG: hypothetical protein Q6352_014455 [Candidatus Freyrarchaeum guaymaensis]
MSSVIRVSREVRERLEVLKRKMNVKSMSKLLEIITEVAEKELDQWEGSPEAFFESLKFSGEAGERDSERVDELLYGRNEG